MVINTRFKFIFLHVPKAAGTSVMSSLNQVPGDHQSWLASTKHETLAEFLTNLPNRRSFSDRLLWRDPTDFFKFGFVRNPWDRMSSFYRYLVEKRPKEEVDTVSNFSDFLLQSHDRVAWIEQLYGMKSQLDYFSRPDGTIQADFLGHYEYLHEDFSAVTRQLGCNATLGHDNRSTNNRSDYRDQFDARLVEIVADRFAEEIELLGYSFDVPNPTKRVSGPINRARAV